MHPSIRLSCSAQAIQAWCDCAGSVGAKADVTLAGTVEIDGMYTGAHGVKTSCPYPALKGVTRLVMCR
jgi:hypothetical protein